MRKAASRCWMPVVLLFTVRIICGCAGFASRAQTPPPPVAPPGVPTPAPTPVPTPTVANSVTVNGIAGSPATPRPFTISRFFGKGEIPNYAKARVDGTPVASQCDVMTRWPDGSLQHALVSFWAAVPSSGSIKVDFVNDTAGNNSGFLVAADMLSQAYNFGGQMELTSGTTLGLDARALVTAGAFRYWLKGPICTQVILEDRGPALAYDLGWDSAKSFHPIFVATFYPGWSGVKVEFIGENAWTTKNQDLSYSLVLKTGNPLNSTPVYSKPTFTHAARTRWRKVFWSGTEPGAVNIDYNLPYMIQSRVLPNFDLSKKVPTSAISDDVAAFNASDKGEINGNALWQKDMPGTGGRPDIGLFPAWYVRYLYTFDPQLYQVMMGNAAASGSVPVHNRESAAGRFFDEAKTLDAFGRPLSLDARPLVSMLGLSGAADAINPIGPASSNGWAVDLAHEGSFAFVPYLITGDWYFLEEVYFFAANDLATSDPGVCEWCRNGPWGLLPSAIQTRGQAWGLRNVAHAALAAPDGTPEKAYFTQKLNNNIAIREGEQNITDGAFYDPSPTSKWTWGRNVVGGGRSNPLHFLNIGELLGETELIISGSPFASENCDSPWMYNYNHIVFGHIEELGFPINKLRQNLALNLLHMLKDPGFNPYLAGAYRVPVTMVSTRTYYQQWADVKQAYKTSFGTPPVNLQTIATWPENDAADMEHGYPRILKAAASFLPGINDGALKGQDAWDWVVASVGYQELEGVNPKWSILPRPR